MASRGPLCWFQKVDQLCVSLWKNDHTSHLIYYLSKQIPDVFFQTESLVVIGKTWIPHHINCSESDRSKLDQENKL